MRVAVFLLFLPSALFAQAPALPATPTVPSPALAGIAHVALRVADLDRSRAFYKSLGFTDAFDLSRDGKVYEAFIKINDRQFIELYPATPKDPQIGFLHLCFAGEDLRAAHDFYVAEGLHPNDVRTAGAGNLLFTMPGPATPTGPQNLEYTQYMPGSLHSRDFGQHLAPDPVSRHLTTVTVAVDDPAAAQAFYTGKLRFTRARRAGSTVFVLPGATDAVELVPSATLGLHARVTFAASADPGKYLKAHGLAFTRDPTGTLLVTDPDGNQIVLRP